MTSKITTVAELRREIAEKLQLVDTYYSSAGPSILKLIDNFEAGLRERADIWKCAESCEFGTVVAYELLSILGDEKEKEKGGGE